MSTGSSIPLQARTQVKTRAHHRCERCGVPAPNGQWHHRRSRRVRAPHRHCACNGLWLCVTCHKQVHNNWMEAQKNGWIVSQWTARPGDVPVQTPWGERYHDCYGNHQFSQLN